VLFPVQSALVHCNMTFAHPPSDLWWVQTIYWDADPCLWFRGYFWHEFTYCRFSHKYKMTRDYRDPGGPGVGVMLLFSYHDCGLELWPVCMLTTQVHMCVRAARERAQEWSLALACSSADPRAEGTCSCVIVWFSLFGPVMSGVRRELWETDRSTVNGCFDATD